MPRFFTPPNQLTLLRILLTPVFVSLFLSPQPSFRLWSIPIFIAGMLTDWYDGWVARRWGFITRWGSHFDPIADKVFISAAFFSFVFQGLVPAWTVWVIVFRDVGITFLRSYSELKGVTFSTSKSAKVKTFVQFTALYYILVTSVGSTALPAGSPYQLFFDEISSAVFRAWLMGFTALLTLASGFQYLYSNRSFLLTLNDNKHS